MEDMELRESVGEYILGQQEPFTLKEMQKKASDKFWFGEDIFAAVRDEIDSMHEAGMLRLSDNGRYSVRKPE